MLMVARLLLMSDKDVFIKGLCMICLVRLCLFRISPNEASSINKIAGYDECISLGLAKPCQTMFLRFKPWGLPSRVLVNVI